jgi:hypothetical protein
MLFWRGVLWAFFTAFVGGIVFGIVAVLRDVRIAGDVDCGVPAVPCFIYGPNTESRSISATAMTCSGMATASRPTAARQATDAAIRHTADRSGEHGSHAEPSGACRAPIAAG